MRRWIALVLIALILVLAGPSRSQAALEPALGALLVALLVVLLSMLPWRRWMPGLPPMPDVFLRPGPQGRWCTHCGRPAPRLAACRCGAAPRGRSKQTQANRKAASK